MLSDADRSRLARYEAFLNFSGELIRIGEVGAVARWLAKQLKFVCNGFAWRYVGLEPSLPPSALAAQESSVALYGAQAKGGVIAHGTDRLSQLSPFEQSLWAGGKALNLDATALNDRGAELPAIFTDPLIAHLHVQPLWEGDRLEALFMIASTGEGFDALDLKFIALTAQFVHRKIGHVRAEQQATQGLLDALNHLRRTQDDLVESEKLAALGALVAGISHELNTPIANARLMSTSLLECLQNLAMAIGGPAPRRSELMEWQRCAREMTELLDRSVRNAATLLTSFKQVAVDQTSERRRVFDLRRCVDDVVNTLGPSFKNQPWIIDNRVPDGIDCDSFPGPLGQIVTNLVQNAVLHAFEGCSEGSVTLHASTQGDRLSLVVADNGKGMDTATLVHIFEPFFTTKLGRGGSGLGLSVSQRIATSVLAGDLRVVSTPGLGTRFTLTMPRRAPRKV